MHGTAVRRKSPDRANRHRPRSGNTQVRSGRELPSSRHHKLEQKKGAAEGSRKEHNRRGEKHSSQHPEDFGAREPRRAMWKSWMERRTSVNRSPCGRRTSLGSAAKMPASPLSIPVSLLRGKVRAATRATAVSLIAKSILCIHRQIICPNNGRHPCNLIRPEAGNRKQQPKPMHPESRNAARRCTYPAAA